MSKTSIERLRTFCEIACQHTKKWTSVCAFYRQRELKSVVAVDSVLSAAQWSTIDNVDNTAKPSTGNDVSASAKWASTDTKMSYMNFNAKTSAHRDFSKKFCNNPCGFQCGICDRPWF